MSKYRNYTNEDVVQHSKEAHSIADLLRKLGLKPAGGNYYNIKRLLQKLNIDTSHWTGQSWNKGQQTKNWQNYTRSSHLKKHILKERGNSCEICKLNIWREQLIKLELHHIDGDRTNNNKENLILLCPNCHSLTSNWKNSKKQRPIGELVYPTGLNPVAKSRPGSNPGGPKKRKLCKDCKKEICSRATRCKSCSKKLQLYKIEWPATEEILALLETSNYTQVAKNFNVSDNAIRKHLKNNGVIPPKKHK